MGINDTHEGYSTLQSNRSAAISHNTWLHRIARVAVRPLVRTSVTPNQLTTIRLTTGVAAGGAMGVGTPWWTHAGCVMFLLSMVLDRADGELARLTGKTSPKGHVYDLWADACCNALFFIGLGVGLRDSVLGLWSVPLGLVAGASVGTILWLVMRVEAKRGARAAELQGFAGFDPDDAVLIAPIAIWLGWSVPLMVAASFGASAFLVFFYWKLQRH